MTENRPEYGLKPCKCGAIPVIDFEYYDCKWFYIKCQNCGLFFPAIRNNVWNPPCGIVVHKVQNSD